MSLNNRVTGMPTLKKALATGAAGWGTKKPPVETGGGFKLDCFNEKNAFLPMQEPCPYGHRVEGLPRKGSPNVGRGYRWAVNGTKRLLM